jgi:hypothetical protein
LVLKLFGRQCLVLLESVALSLSLSLSLYVLIRSCSLFLTSIFCMVFLAWRNLLGQQYFVKSFCSTLCRHLSNMWPESFAFLVSGKRV